MRHLARGLTFALALGATAQAAPPAAAREPTTLKECYLQVALTRSTADTVYLAREICDVLFRPAPRAVAVLSPPDRTCSEWWFDRQGRYESDKHYCSLEAAGEGLWHFACQWKGPGEKRVTYVELREEGDRYTRVAPLRGADVGELFKSLAGCVRHKLGAAPEGG